VGEGPYDSEDPIVERLGRGSGRIDFGSLRIPIPARAQLQVEKGNGDLLRAVHVLVPSGRVSLSALAAPRTNPLWRGLAGEIGESLSGDGARVRAEWGEWGREVEAASNGAISRFIGVDGPRWMLYGVATGPEDGAGDLAVVLRDMMRGTVVFRGPDPLPVKTVLPLRLPEGLEERVEQAREVSREVSREDARERTEPAVASTGDRSGSWSRVERARPAAVNGSGQFPAVPPAREPMPPRRPPAVPPAAVPPAQPAHPGFDSRPASRPAAAQAIGSLGRPAIGSLGRPASGLPPVPATPPGGGFGMSAAEATWSLANPVVDAAEVAQQPAWASLSAAPSFWPHERYRPEEPPAPGEPPSGTGSYGTGSYSGGAYSGGSYGTGSFEAVRYGSDRHEADRYEADRYGSDRHEADRHGTDRYGSGSFAADSYGAGSYGAERYGTGSNGSGSFESATGGSRPPEPSSYPPAGPPGYPTAGPSTYPPAGPPVAEPNGYAPAGPADWSTNGSGRPVRLGDLDLSGPDDVARTPLERAILAEMSSAAGSTTDGVDGPRSRPEGPAEAEADAWTGSDSDLLSSTDGLHAVLMNDSAATRGWAARPGRRRRAD
jgi:hypothetical protein